MDRGGSDPVIVSIDSSVTVTLSQVPAVMSDAVHKQVIDIDLMNNLNSSKTINWCRAVKPLYPLRTSTIHCSAGKYLPCMHALRSSQHRRVAIADTVSAMFEVPIKCHKKMTEARNIQKCKFGRRFMVFFCVLACIS